MINKHNYPILEYDTNLKGVIHAPNHYKKLENISGACVFTFFSEAIEKLKKSGKIKEISVLHSEAGRHPIYEMPVKDSFVLIFQPLIGSACAAAFMEELIAIGVNRFIACGACGVLNPELLHGHIIIPNEALRDEGTSYHYLPPARTINLDPISIKIIKSKLNKRHLEYITGKVWTTDAFFRETPEMVAYRKSEGCIAVEMECATFACVSQFRKVKFGQILYAGDDVSGKEWNNRNWKSNKDQRLELIEISAEIALEL